MSDARKTRSPKTTREPTPVPPTSEVRERAARARDLLEGDVLAVLQHFSRGHRATDLDAVRDALADELRVDARAYCGHDGDGTSEPDYETLQRARLRRVAVVAVLLLALEPVAAPAASEVAP